MTWQQQDAGRSEVKFAIEWSEKYAPAGWDGSLTKMILEPVIWRWDKNETTDNSTFNETLSKDPNAGGGSASWVGLKYIGCGTGQNLSPSAKSGWRKLDFFYPRTYTLTSSEQTVTMTITTTSGFGTNVNGYKTIGARTFTFSFKLPAKTEVAKAPEWKPCNVVLKRGSGTAMDLKWTVPLHLREREDGGFTDTAWIFQASKNMSTKYVETRLGSTHYTADKIWCRDLGLNSTSHAQEYDRKKYHPVTDGRYLTDVTGSVLFYDWSDRHPLSTTNQTSAKFTFKVPKVPEWDEPVFDTSTGKVSCSLTAAEDKDEFERYDTQYWVTRRDNLGGSYTEAQVLKRETTQEGSASLETDATADANHLSYDQWIDIKFHAVSRGLAGNSTEVTKLYTIAHPPRPQITGITVSGVNSVNGQVTVLFESNVNIYHPADTITLQRLSNTSVKTIEMARISQSWEDVSGATDDGTCSGFIDELNAARPDRNKHVWYRIKTVRANYVEYSDPVQAVEIEKVGDPQMDDVVSIASLIPGDEGALNVVLAWDDDGDDSNGTEVSWSEHEDAWKSTEQPSTYNVPDTWMDETPQVAGKDNSAQLTIRGLTEGVAYYVKARRYLDSGENILYGTSYATGSSEVYPITLVTALKKVYLYGPQYVPRGEGFRVNWTYDSDADQTSWNLYKHYNDTKVVLESGSDNLGSVAIGKDVLEGLDEIVLSVSVSIGNEHVESDPITVKIVDCPNLVAVTDSLMKSQPMRFYASCDVSTVDLIAKVYSRGVSSGTPDGEMTQVYGDVVWSDKLSPTWYLNEDERYYTIIVLPEKLDFWNGGIYTLEVTAVSTLTGLSSETASMNFEIDWVHISHPPGPGTYVSSNAGNMSVTIHVDKPDNWQAGDVYDVYRVSNDSVDLIVEGQEYGVDAKDCWAPFGKNISLYYRIANRTKDGDVQWADYVYGLYGYQLRIDWGAGEFVDLPYNLELKSQYDKNYEMHTHLDGTTSGHWNPGFKKTDNFTTKLVRVDDNLTANKLRSLGEYAGPAYVRTPDGGAYQANVTVSGIDNKYDDLLLGVTVKAERHSLTDTYRLHMNDFEVVEQSEPVPEEAYTRQQILAWNSDVPQAHGTYALNEEPVGIVFKVELSTSYDNYMEPWEIPATYSGRAVTLGDFGSALTTYLEQTQSSPNTQYMLKAFYNITE